ncbi:PAS domain-containing protein [Cellulomonas hominis]|uniref:PAS domain-containing protein n=1 Tax=Cellulomonas hominis TaxID=156981 RepID=UPI001B9D6A8B|nr:PAS domain-containing protein [Cellulomonas hominis]VTR77460.1 hypothetical protein CHMI_02229 [Cellulomonas hominis]
MSEVMSPERVLALGTRATAGAYRLDLRDGAWWWSDEIYAMHGFEPHEVVPSTELLVAHQHPADRRRASDALEEAIRTGAPFSCVHRIVDAQGRERVVTVVGEGRERGRDADRATVLAGYFVDVTEVVRDRAQAAASESISAAAESRATIDQAVGVLAFTYGYEPAAAFAVLRAASNDANVPIRLLARAIVTALPSLRGDPRRVSAFVDGLLAPAHRGDGASS